jgi:hypothetical protein
MASRIGKIRPTHSKEIKHKAGAYTFFLQPIDEAILLMTLSEADRPPVPMVEVKYAGGLEGTEPNPNDPQYLKDIRDWESIHTARILRMCIVYGVKRVENALGAEAFPSAVELQKIRFVYGESLPSEIAVFYWYADLLRTTARGFMNLALGQTQVTEEGLKADEERFRADSKGSGVSGKDNSVPPTSTLESGISE